ncbi:LysR family transcriptional regulator protein (plasmid) [Rhizobium phaseoli]|uniref:LysR family transcriptional regulator n=1 Tax=Rhizobium phaseoli TaxID=396 RepID=A0A192TQZ6_9HYPH|nr:MULTISPECIES: LysR substrate-binding domain-containing protein [Rhizobium]ANL38337.1 LysR family transcriptional regulator protein [Rhizobium phaseoli]ANL57331.1 LysR family transcriptional regulator protein [Rhizobium phaseoli]ANL76417.1 LysR family transcriptional regulator protein [Rhizobium phaseoli]ANL89228.1 LysR family transcriptional regulator protein [Rhizobium phaseoli]ANL95737.1 LysR family transcriptional regulator protein [Rhizobium phaseoli]
MVGKTVTGVTIRQLQIFREVLRAGSERHAAKILKITQPAVSQQIRQLELEVDLALFARENNRLVPTDRAWDLLRSVEGALQSVDRIERSMAALRNEEAGSLSLAAPGVFCLNAIPRAIQAVRKSNPLSFQIRSGSHQLIAEQVLNGRADLGVSRLPLDERAFEWAPAATARNVCLFQAGHRLAAKEVITPEDIIDEALVDIEPQFAAHQMNINALRYRGVEPDLAVEYDANSHDVGFVAAGVGISIINSLIAREYRQFGLEFRPFEPGAIYHYVVFWQRGRQLTIGMRQTVDELLGAFAAT